MAGPFRPNGVLRVLVTVRTEEKQDGCDWIGRRDKLHTHFTVVR